MKETNNFYMKFLIEEKPSVVFNAIKDVKSWWSKEITGNTNQLNDEFVYRHGEVHYSKHRIIEIKKNTKIVWLTIDSKLTFVNSQKEWDGTKLIFEISKEINKTKLEITHLGLTPKFECYEGCSKGWTHYFKNSLLPLIIKGQGQPYKLVN